MIMEQMDLFSVAEENTPANVSAQLNQTVQTVQSASPTPVQVAPVQTVSVQPVAVQATPAPAAPAPKPAAAPIAPVTVTMPRPKKTAKPKKAKAPRPQLPTECKELADMPKTGQPFEDFIFEINGLQKLPASCANAFAVNAGWYGMQAYTVHGDTIVPDDASRLSCLADSQLFTNAKYAAYMNTKREYSANLNFIDQAGNVWISRLGLMLDHSFSDVIGNGGYYSAGPTTYTQAWSSARVLSYTVDAWKLTTRLQPKRAPGNVYLASRDDLRRILKNTNPYGYSFFENFDPELGIMAPYLEQVSKAGFAIADAFISNWNIGRIEQTTLDQFNRLFAKETSIKKIFKTSKVVYKTLKDERNLRIWDVYRRMDKMGRLTADQVQRCYDCGFMDSELDSVNSILNFEYKGKKVFTFDSLLNYLNRLDLYEAIGNQRAFMILPDYLRMCNQLEMEPRIDGDSLMREHNIAARLCYEKNRRDEPANFAKMCKEMAANDYEENVFFVRAIRDYDDLFDEARQQHNCLASYGSVIASGKELVYVMREKANPDKSLITVSLNPQQTQIRQKYMSYNRPIHNKAQTEFLERWLKMVKGRNNKGFASIADFQKTLKQQLI